MARRALLCGAAVLCLACVDPSDERPSRVLLIGDSITAGRMSGEGGKPFAEALAERLGRSFEVVNLGCGGASSRDWTRDAEGRQPCPGRDGRFHYYDDLARPQLPADLAVVLLGTNDALGYLEGARGHQSRRYRGWITRLTQRLLEDGAERVILLPPPPLCVDRRRASDRFIPQYQSQISKLCKTIRGAYCGPELTTLLSHPEDFEDCDPHPNAAGHAKIARSLAASILEPPACSNGGDDDGDQRVDYGEDPGCETTMDSNESG